MHRLLKLLLIVVAFALVVAALAVIGSSLMNSVSLEVLNSMNASIDRSFWPLTIMRMFIIASIYLAWHSVVGVLSRRGDWNDTQIRRVKNGRSQFVLLMLFLDVIVIQLPHFLK